MDVFFVKSSIRDAFFLYKYGYNIKLEKNKNKVNSIRISD